MFEPYLKAQGGFFEQLSDQVGIHIYVCYFIIVILVIVFAYAICKAIQGKGGGKTPAGPLSPYDDQSPYGEGYSYTRMPRAASHSRVVHEEKVVTVKTVRGKKCKACGRDNKLDALFCSDCGELM